MNRVRKVLASIVLAMSLMPSARADVIFWMIDFEEAGTVSPWPDDTTIPLVWVVASRDPLSSVGGTMLENPEVYGGGIGMEMAGNQSEAVSAFELGDYDAPGYTFFMEMGMAPGQADYVSTGVSYEDLVRMGYVKSVMDPAGSIWNGGMLAWSPTHGVPEPSSGLLVLVGGALLALRRRQRQDGLGEQCNQCNQKVQFDS